MTAKMQEIKSFIDSEINNFHEGDELKYEENGSDGFYVIAENWTLSVEMLWGDIQVFPDNQWCSFGKDDIEWFNSIMENIPDIQQIWDKYEDEDN